jgi:hypothetical protein
VVGLFFLAQTLMPSLTSGASKPIMDYSALDWLKAFWAKDSPDPDKIGMPIDYPLWFIRDLMMVMLFSPVVYGWVSYQPHGSLFGARALSGKRFSGGEQLLCLCLSWDAVGVGYQGRGSVSPSGL